MNAEAGVYPKGTDVLLLQVLGPVLRRPGARFVHEPGSAFPGGMLPTWQFRGVADLARRFGPAVMSDCHHPRQPPRFARSRPADAQRVPRSAWPSTVSSATRGPARIISATVTSTPTSGIDPEELIETLPLAKVDAPLYPQPSRDVRPAAQVQHRLRGRRADRQPGRHQRHRLQGRERVAGGQRFTRTSRPGFTSGSTLGGITGHKDFARDTGVLLQPDECVEVAGAIVRVYLKNGDRTDRKKARLKYVLDDWGFPKIHRRGRGKELGKPFRRNGSRSAIASRPPPEDRWAHVGVPPPEAARAKFTSASCFRSGE